MLLLQLSTALGISNEANGNGCTESGTDSGNGGRTLAPLLPFGEVGAVLIGERGRIAPRPRSTARVQQQVRIMRDRHARPSRRLKCLLPDFFLQNEVAHREQHHAQYDQHQVGQHYTRLRREYIAEA